MPYKTIQQNFANGELNPKMQGRSDVDMYYKSAQKMRDVVTTPYGGFVRRPGTTKIGELTDYDEEQGEKNVRLLPFVFNNDQSYVMALSEGKVDIYHNDLLENTVIFSNLTEERIKELRFAQSADSCFFVHPELQPHKLSRNYASPTLNLARVVDGYKLDPTVVDSKENNPAELRTNLDFSCFADDSFELNLAMYLPFLEKYEDLRVQFVINKLFYFEAYRKYDSSKGNVLIFRVFETSEYKGSLELREEDIEGGTFLLKLSRDSDCNYIFSYSTNGNIYTNIVSYHNENNAELSSENPIIRFLGSCGNIYVDLSKTYINKNEMLLWNYENANTARWVLSKIAFESFPRYDFDKGDPVKGKGTLKPDVVDGTVRLTLSENLSANVVGQYIEGNGGRVKITSQKDKTLTGYTVIGFYTNDEIAEGDWTYTTKYEPVWSDKRGWPCSVTFHQGRLWFGGSKSRPQTVWGSKVGLFYKFSSTGGYDNDAIEFTLDTDTLNKITDIYSAKGLYIFTLGGEFVCQTSYSEPITPKNVSALKQSSNGSWEKTQPVELEGSVIFVERKGQALMNFAYLEQDSYASSNASLVNSHLINQPEDLDVERNNLTQQTNYVYIVNKDGSMCVVNLLAAQGITGGFTLWNTQGKVKSVCVLPDSAYIAVEREGKNGRPIFIEKLDWNNLTDNAEVVTLNEATQFTVPHLAGNTVDVLCDGKFVGKYKADEEGLIVFSKPLTGKVEIGLPFRSYVQSNFLEVAQMGSGVGKLKRLASMVVRVLDTPEVTINGETQKGTGKGVEDIHFYGIGDWDEKPTWEFTQNTPYKFNVLAAQMDLNYQLSTESY